MKANTCKHYNGYREPYICTAGCNYQTWRHEGKSVLDTLPCFSRNNVVCTLMELPTESELAEFQRETEDIVANVLEIGTRLASGEGEGSFECKYCKKGTVTWASNPVRGSCDSCGWGGRS